MEMPDLASEPRFSDNLQRMAHLDELDDMIAQWCERHSLEQISAVLDKEDVPFTKVYSMEDIMQDSHLQAREAIIELTDDELGKLPAPATVPRFSHRPQVIPSSGPETGQHNAEIFTALGLTRETQSALKARGII